MLYVQQSDTYVIFRFFLLTSDVPDSAHHIHYFLNVINQ